mmetsp:Transcript_7848/g.15070  ORF Transcript_7848/g.15070 Transcript_7848/m.15070 type:complete len:275 (-) Transcript_7848:2513-3337(-)
MSLTLASDYIMKIGPVFRSGSVIAAAVECSVFFKKEEEYLRFQLHEGPVTLLSASEEYWVTGGEDKLVTVLKLDWEAKEVNLVKRFLASKKVVGGAVASNTLLFGDKHGDVWRVDLNDLSQPPVFAMGHQAQLEGVWLGRDLLTYDKEFKIKVSGFPDTYELKQVLLGHSHNITSAIQIDSHCYSSDGSGQVFKWNGNSIEASTNLNGPLVLFPNVSSLVAVTCEQVFLLDPGDLHTVREVQSEHEGVVRMLGNELCTISTTGQDIELHTLVIE